VSRGIIICALIGAVDLFAAQPQDISKPLTESELLNTIDSFASGDPVRKQPLSVGDEKPEKKEAKPVPKKEKGPTEITALEATFDQKSHLAVFLRQVVVKDPEFNVNCDKLTAFLKHEEKPNGEAPKAGAATAPTAKPATARGTPKPASPPVATPIPAGKDAKESKGGGLERAIAEANPGARVLVTQDKVEADGSISRNIGHGPKCNRGSTPASRRMRVPSSF
jgi:hypothetical protein